MRRYLLAWELGGDLGHARRQAAIARGLLRLGHEPLLALTDVASLDPRSLDGIGCVPAPRVLPPDVADPAPVSASAILVNMGYADVASLAGALAGWSGLLRAFAPHAVVGDYAPGAMLAARAAGIPRVSVGSGFSMPPLGDPMPPLRPGTTADRELLARSDATLMAAVREACARASSRAASPPSRARELFEADATLVCAWPELDPFGPRDDVEYVGPQADGGALPVVRWSGAASPRVFAYLKPRDERFPALLEALAATCAEAIVAAPGLAPGEAASLSRERLRVLPHAVDLAALLEDADLCLAHAGAGTVAAAMRSGVPLALLPRNLEQWLIARRTEALGTAVMLADRRSTDFAAWLRAALSREELRTAARSARAAVRPSIDAAERIARVG